MKTAIIVPTCERPLGAHYVDQTLRALDREGADCADHRIVLQDGPVNIDAPAGWELLKHPERRGIRAMMWWAFEIASNLDADHLLFCEDDIEPIKNALRYILANEGKLTLDTAFVDFYDFNNNRHPLADGLHKRSINGQYWGNQCMLFPRHTFEWLLDCDPFSVKRWQAPSNADRALGFLLGSSPWPEYSVHMPRLVRHKGEISAAHATRDRRLDMLTIRTPDSGYDALQLCP